MTPAIYLTCIGAGLLFSFIFFFVKAKVPKESDLHKYIFFVIGYVLIFELYANYLAYDGRQNVWVYNLFFVIGETLIILLYLRYLFDSKPIKKIIVLFIYGFLTLSIINTLFFQDPTEMLQHYSHLLGSFGVVAFSCVFLYRVFLNDQYWDQSLLSVPHFWNVSAILLFYCPNLIYFGSINIIWDIDRQYITILSSMNRVFAAILYLILGISFYTPLIFSENRDGG